MYGSTASTFCPVISKVYILGSVAVAARLVVWQMHRLGQSPGVASQYRLIELLDTWHDSAGDLMLVHTQIANAAVGNQSIKEPG